MEYNSNSPTSPSSPNRTNTQQIKKEYKELLKIAQDKKEEYENYSVSANEKEVINSIEEQMSEFYQKLIADINAHLQNRMTIIKQNIYGIIKIKENIKEHKLEQINRIIGEIEGKLDGLDNLMKISMEDQISVTDESRYLKLQKQTEEASNDTISENLLQKSLKSQVGHVKYKFTKSYIEEMIQINNENDYGESLLHLCLPLTGSIHIYDIISKKGREIKIGDRRFPRSFDSIIVGCDIIMAGGVRKTEKNLVFEDSTLQISVDGGRTRDLARMNIRKGGLSLCQVNPSMIYCIGGYNSKGMMDETEIYDVAFNKWVNGPPLNEKKAGCASCSFNHRFIYSFGGYNARYVDTIEKLDSLHRIAWQVVSLSKCLSWTARDRVGALQYSNKSILLFGGNAGSPLSDSLQFNVNSFTMKKLTPLDSGDYFEHSKPVLGGGGLFVLGSQDKALWHFAHESWTRVDWPLWITTPNDNQPIEPIVKKTLTA